MSKLHRENKCYNCRRSGYMGYSLQNKTHIGTGAKWTEYLFGCQFCNCYESVTKEIFENFASMANIIGARAVNS